MWLSQKGTWKWGKCQGRSKERFIYATVILKADRVVTAIKKLADGGNDMYQGS